MYNRKPFNFDDILVREQVIKFYKNIFEIQLEQTNPNSKLIDLTGFTDYHFGVEVERGGWKGNYWDIDSYCMISGLGFPTINIPRRKEKYWKKVYTFYNKEYVNKEYDKNQFVRTNKDFTQFILITPDVINDNTKKIITKFTPKNSDELEEFMSFRKEDVKTYNLIDDKFVLDSVI
jgi:hypothetical protein